MANLLKELGNDIKKREVDFLVKLQKAGKPELLIEFEKIQTIRRTIDMLQSELIDNSVDAFAARTENSQPKLPNVNEAIAQQDREKPDGEMPDSEKPFVQTVE